MYGSEKFYPGGKEVNRAEWVKYTPQNQTLTCSNNDFCLTLKIRICEQENQQPLIVFDPQDIFNFVELDFFSNKTNLDLNPNRYHRFIDLFLYQGCSVVLDGYLYVNVTGLKHFFSSLVSHRVFENSLDDLIDWKGSKFLNWVLNFDFNSSILKALKLPNCTDICKFCKKAGFDSNDMDDFFGENSEVITKWKSNLDGKEDKNRYDDEFLAYLACLFKRAAKEIKAIVFLDNKYSQSRSINTPLANYDPREDWASSCPIIKLFIDEILTEAQSDLYKVVFRNLIFLGNQKKNYPFKPQSCYFISCVIKYLHDKQKILDLLSTIGIAVGDDAANRLERRQIDEFNSVFWDLPAPSTVMAVMDNNQADFGSKTYDPLHDEHHVDAINVLQVIKPTGIPNLSKSSKQISDLSASFIDSTSPEKRAGDFFPQNICLLFDSI